MESTSGRGSTHSPGREASLGANGFKLGLILMILVARARECAPMAFLTAHRASGRTYAQRSVAGPLLELPLLRLLGDYRPSQIPEKPFEPYIDTSHGMGR